jgi:hypothetical protein
MTSLGSQKAGGIFFLSHSVQLDCQNLGTFHVIWYKQASVVYFGFQHSPVPHSTCPGESGWERSTCGLDDLFFFFLFSLWFSIYTKVIFLKPSLFNIIKMIKKNYGSFPHFQEDSNALKYVLFGYCMNKLWIFEVWNIASPKTWVGNTKTVNQHDL